MPLVGAAALYADSLSAPSMLFWRYSLALVALAIAQGRASRSTAGLARRAWRIRARRGDARRRRPCASGKPQTLETSIAVLLFYTYPAVTLRSPQLFFKRRSGALRSLHRHHPRRRRADHRAWAARRHDRSARPSLGPAGAVDLRALPRDQRPAVATPPAAGRRLWALCRDGGDLRARRGVRRPRCAGERGRLDAGRVHRARAGRADDDVVFVQRAAPRGGQLCDPRQCRAGHRGAVGCPGARRRIHPRQRNRRSTDRRRHPDPRAVPQGAAQALTRLASLATLPQCRRGLGGGFHPLPCGRDPANGQGG